MSDADNSGLGVFDAAVVDAFLAALESFAATLTANFASLTAAQPEDQLKAPVSALLTAGGVAAGCSVVTRTETKVDGVAGRPDIGVDADGLLVGNVELKAPGIGAQPHLFADQHSRDQFERFKKLPNLIYTDGREWALFRNGSQVGDLVRLSSDPTSGGAAGMARDDAVALLELLGVFFNWSPVVPSSPSALAKMLAPLTRLLRDEVLADVHADGVMNDIAREWRSTLFPEADDATFADGYAQTFTYALLLARLEGAPAPLDAETAARELDSDHALLAQALRVLGQRETRDAIGLPVSLLERVIGAVDAKRLSSGKDPWLYFYEDFLAAYDPAQRNNRGVYYTPFEVVAAQVKFCQEILVERFGKVDGFGDADVVVLDPAAGTGTYPLKVVSTAIENAVARSGEGIRGEVATRLARNMNAFELLVGPYAVTHLRLSRTFADEGATVADDGVNVFLTDTLAEPVHEGFASTVPLFQRPLAREQERASRVKDPTTYVTVVLGNPPYDRDTSGADGGSQRKGGMIRHGATPGSVGLLKDFLDPLSSRVRGAHSLNLYNDYVYFWRWAIWKTCEQSTDHGITCFITPSSFLAGPGYAGMREMMRREFDEIWLIDLGGEGRGARRDDNVFEGVLTPVVITVAVRMPGGDAATRRRTPAVVRYRRIEGTRAEKLVALTEVDILDDEGWEDTANGWQDTFVPVGGEGFATWPALGNVFGWTPRGIQFSRTWPVGETTEVLERRWQTLVSAKVDERAELLHESRDAKVARSYPSFLGGPRLAELESLAAGDEPDGVEPVAFRSFDHQWCIADRRVIDMPRPALWESRSAEQVFFTSYPDGAGLAPGPALVANVGVPDLNSFNNRGGLVLPLFKDPAGTVANIPAAVVQAIGTSQGRTVTGVDIAAYIFGLLGTSAYVDAFGEDAVRAGVRIPFTLDSEMFDEVGAFGRELLWWATFGERFTPVGKKGAAARRLPTGTARNTKAVSGAAAEYPESFSYDAATKTIHVGDGEFGPVEPEVWEFEVSGLKVIRSWLAYRMKARAGRSSSPLDAIRPESWTFSAEFVELLAVIEHFVAAGSDGSALLARVVAGEVMSADAMPEPSHADREPYQPPEDPEDGGLLELMGE